MNKKSLVQFWLSVGKQLSHSLRPAVRRAENQSRDFIRIGQYLPRIVDRIVDKRVALPIVIAACLALWAVAAAQEGIVYLPVSFGGEATSEAVTSTPTPIHTPTTTENDSLEWDPRLDQRGAILIPAEPEEGQGYWRLVRGLWMNEEESGGRVHIFVDTLDENAERQTGVPLLVTWADGNTSIVTEEKPGEPAANFAMFTWAPAYKIQPSDGNPADAVDGLGLGSIEQPRFKIHTSYDFTWMWTIHSSASPTATITPTQVSTPTVTPSITATVAISSATATPTLTPALTPTQILSATPTATLEPTLTPTTTATQTPTPTETPTETPTVLATPVVDEQMQFSQGQLVGCEPNQKRTLLNGTVFVDDVPASGHRVIFDFESGGDGITPPQITRENPAGFYEHIVSQGNWFVWIVNESGVQISAQVPFTIDESDGNCRIVTVNFYG